MIATPIAVVPIVALLAGIVVTYLLDAYSADRRAGAATAGLSLAIALVASVALATGEGGAYSAFGDRPTVLVSGLGTLLGVVGPAVGLIALVGVRDALDDPTGAGRALALAVVAGVVTIGYAPDAFTLYLGFEMLAVATYALVPYAIDRSAAVVAGRQYVVLNAVGSAIAIFGIALLATTEGGLSFVDPTRAVASVGPLAAVSLVVGFGVKGAVVPLHAWVPDAYAEAPHAATVLLAALATPVAIVAMARCLRIVPADVPVGALLIAAGIGSMLVGNLLAYGQSTVRRVLACSSIPHVGYVLVGIGAAFVASGGSVAARGALFHVVANAIMKAGAFVAVAALLGAIGAGADATLDDIAGLGRRLPLAAGTLAVAVLALAGVPPLVGFWGKLLIVIGSANLGALGAVVAIAVVASSFLSLGYYLPIVRALYASPDDREVGTPSRAIAASLAVALVAIVVVGIAPMVGLDAASAGADAIAPLGVMP
ncbi:MAG: NADH-quinone oxidoreductase subunit N [Halococcoides sp.]